MLAYYACLKNHLSSCDNINVKQKETICDVLLAVKAIIYILDNLTIVTIKKIQENIEYNGWNKR